MDRYIPTYEMHEHHQIRAAAPAELTYAAARDLDLLRCPLVRAILRGRELVMGATRRRHRGRSQSLVREVLARGWGVLVEDPGREIVFGAVTQPWTADVRFRSISAEALRERDRCRSAEGSSCHS